jgi:hypothetical protein
MFGISRERKSDSFRRVSSLGVPRDRAVRIRPSVATRGRVVIFEPGLGVLGRFVYNVLHHEPVGERESIRWFAPDGSDLRNAGYYAAQGMPGAFLSAKRWINPWMIGQSGPRNRSFPRRTLRPGDSANRVCTRTQRSPWVWLLIGCCPVCLGFFATRLLVVLEKDQNSR